MLRFWKSTLQKVLRRVLRRRLAVGLKGKMVLRRVPRRGVSRLCLERPVGEYKPLGVCPKNPNSQTVGDQYPEKG